MLGRGVLFASELDAPPALLGREVEVRTGAKEARRFSVSFCVCGVYAAAGLPVCVM